MWQNSRVHGIHVVRCYTQMFPHIEYSPKSGLDVFVSNQYSLLNSIYILLFAKQKQVIKAANAHTSKKQ